MKISELVEKLEALKTSQDDLEVKVVETTSGDITEINDVNFSFLNGGEVHISVELDYEEG